MNLDNVSKKLIELRNGKPQREVARAVGITTSALSMYENGNRMPRDEIKIKLADYYNMPVQDIFFDELQHEM